jgi:TP901 family phage tail tape measure protein
MDVGSLKIVIDADVGGLRSGLREADQGLDSAARKAKGLGDSTEAGLQKSTEGWKLLGTTMLGIGTAGIMVAADFESSMKEISARTGLVGDDLEDVRAFALQMGADTSFSAQQASDAFLQLLTSGSSVQESMETLPHVMNLAAASGMDLGYTADILTDTLAQFGLEVGDAAAVADIFAKAAGASSAEAGDIAAGLANVGPVANMFGMTVDEAAAALATLSENGIKGAEAGTALKSVLLNLSRPTKKVEGALERLGVELYDSNGDFRDFDSIIDDIGLGLDGLPMQEQIELSTILGGSYGVVGLNALRASGGIDEMLAAMEASAGASEVAEARLGGFHGAVERLGGALETLAITTLTPLMESVITPAINITVETIDTWSNDIPAQAAELGGHIGDMIVEGMKSGDWASTFVGNLINDIGEALAGTNVEAEVPIEPIALIPTAAGEAMIADYNADVNALLERGLPVSYAVQMMMEVQQGFTVLPQPEIDVTWDTPETGAELAAMMALSNPVTVMTSTEIDPVNATDPAGFNLKIGGYMDGIVNGHVFGIDTDVAATPTLSNPIDVITKLAADIQALNLDTTDTSNISVMAGLANGADVEAGIEGSLQARNYDTSVSATVHVQVKTMYEDFMSGVDVFTSPSGDLSIPSGQNYNGTPDNDGDPLTPMKTGGKVPYDNFAALLHKGEVVVPADYVDGMGRGGPTIIIEGGIFLNSKQEMYEIIREAAAEAGL